MFGASWRDLLSVVVTAVAMYATLLVLVRVAGRRTVSQLSAFDVLITIALGSTFATSVVSDPPSYGRGATAVVSLLTIQLIVESFRQRVAWLRRLLDFPPTTVLDDRGLHLDRSISGPQITADEVEAAVRAAGYENPAEVALVVLEGNGRFSVLPRRHD